MYFQTLNRMMVIIAQSLSAAQPGTFSNPSAYNSMFTGPLEGLKIIFQTAATATKEAMYGKKITVRKKLRAFMPWFRITARNKLASRVSGTVPAV